MKQILKQRGLSLVGNKSDLIQRLQTAMINESQNQLLFNIDKQFVKDQSKVEIDEDAILGDDDDGQSIKNDDSLIQNEELLLSETLDTEKLTRTTASNMMKTTPLNVQPTKTVNLKVNTNNPSTEPKSLTATSENTQTSNPAKTNKLPLSVEEQKRLRMLKFADPKLINRAQRFGIPTKETQPAEENKLLQRMERFGEAVSSKVKNLNEQERLKRRQERFGQVTSNGQNNKSTTALSTVSTTNSNILKRQQRFGIVEKTVGNTNNVSFFS